MKVSTLNETVNAYFAKQNQSDATGVVGLFSKDAEVHNAGFAPVMGHEGVRGFCENLYARTASRNFRMLAMVEDDNVAFAEWEVTMEFRKGAQIGPFKLAKNFTVKLRGANKFDFDAETGLIQTLRVYHETSTVGRLAQENAE